MLEINLKDRVGVVTGVTSGVGLGVARMLARSGCKVSGCGRSSEKSEGALAFLEMLREEQAEGVYMSIDVADVERLQYFVDSTVKKYNRIDILVSNAGVNVFEGAEQCTLEKWQFNMDLNLKAHWQIGKMCKPYLEKSGKGVILIMTSNHANYTIPGCFPYNVSKTAIKGLVQTLAIEWGPSIRSLGVAPGFIETEGNQKWFDGFEEAEEERARTIELHPVKRIGTVDEVGALCAFLASDMAAFISGTTYLMDGGRSALMQ